MLTLEESQPALMDTEAETQHRPPEDKLHSSFSSGPGTEFRDPPSTGTKLLITTSARARLLNVDSSGGKLHNTASGQLGDSEHGVDMERAAQGPVRGGERHGDGSRGATPGDSSTGQWWGPARP